jgi:hypothetical protein
MCRVVQVPLRGVRVVSRNFVISLFVMSRRFAVMTRRVFVMFRCLVMMLCRLLRHRSSSFHLRRRTSRPEEGCSLFDERIVSE